MDLLWCLWSDLSADSTGWFPTSMCELHRKVESRTGWCHLHCATAVFKDTGKLTPFSLPSPCSKRDTVQSHWRPPPWPRGEVAFTGSHRDPNTSCSLLFEDTFTLVLLVKAWLWFVWFFWKLFSVLQMDLFIHYIIFFSLHLFSFILSDCYKSNKKM